MLEVHRLGGGLRAGMRQCPASERAIISAARFSIRDGSGNARTGWRRIARDDFSSDGLCV